MSFALRSLSPSTSLSNRRRRVTRASETENNKVADESKKASSVNQLLGIRGAAQETEKLVIKAACNKSKCGWIESNCDISYIQNKWKIRLQLAKPVTWPPLVCGVACGAAASGNFHWNMEDVAKSVVCMIMSGPCLAGYTQTLNDWYDREVDAINEPYRPIPSGAISEVEVRDSMDYYLAQFVCSYSGLQIGDFPDLVPAFRRSWLGLLFRCVGHTSHIVLYLALGGSFVSYIYSAPPLKLKRNGWMGNFAMGVSYISLPWWVGQALFGVLTPDIIVLTLLYSIAGLGIAIINDFKSIEGDTALGLQSFPVAFGIESAKWISVGAINITQITISGYLLGAGKPYHALALISMMIPQVIFQVKYLLKDPVKYDVRYQASAQPFFVLGLLVTALAMSH